MSKVIKKKTFVKAISLLVVVFFPLFLMKCIHDYMCKVNCFVFDLFYNDDKRTIDVELCVWGETRDLHAESLDYVFWNYEIGENNGLRTVFISLYECRVQWPEPQYIGTNKGNVTLSIPYLKKSKQEMVGIVINGKAIATVVINGN